MENVSKRLLNEFNYVSYELVTYLTHTIFLYLIISKNIKLVI